MLDNSKRPLKIFNASAGSGKTYNLVKEYILLLLSDEKDSNRFARIIAMTFTNKAAIEMKTRIIQALDLLSYPQLFGKKSDEYAIVLGNELGINPHEVHVRSKVVLQNILHRYEDFHVMTIDKFNLKLIRSFSRDLDLPNDFEVILNEKEVIEQVVDLLLDQLGKQGVLDVTKKVFEYAKNNLDEGEQWNFRSQLIDFGGILSKEKNQALIEKLLEVDFSVERYTELNYQLRIQRESFVTRCQSVFKLFTDLAIDESELPGKSTTLKGILKIGTYADFELLPVVKSVTNQIEKELKPNQTFPLELQTALIELNNYAAIHAKEYFVLQSFLKNFYNMAMLQYMAKSLDSIKKNEQLIRISEFNKLISDLVKNEDAPFIYERLGTRFQHFLLDEFQDTSRLQWLNMVPLVHESISNENINLIVGDPKQSIYRFKNGVAEQFVALPKIYNPEKDASISQKSNYFDQMGSVKSLDDNWRSSPTIVNFNNAFFPLLRNELPLLSQDFYNSIYQNPKSNLPGYVEIISEKAKIDELEIVQKIIEKIQECEEDGFKRGDICLLADKNQRANIWAIELTKAGYKIVSAESLLVQNEVKVKLVLSYLKRRLNPSNLSEKKRFAEIFFRVHKQNAIEQYRSYFSKKIGKDEKEYSFFDDDKFILDHFESKAAFFCKYENLYDLIQSFYRMLGWDELKNPYLHHFADFAFEFELAKGPDLKSFICFYGEQKSKLAIQLPESDDAIKIMTIHKSKGLEFPVVIVPYLNFDTSIMSTSKFLIEVEDKILYSTLKKESPIDEIANFNSYELDQILTDKVNMCYVAFTRPMERLFVFNYFDNSNFGAIAHSCFEAMPEAEIENEALKISLGVRAIHQANHEVKTTAFFEPLSSKDNLWFPEISLQDSVDLAEPDQLSIEQRFGNQFHLAMAAIENPSSITSTLAELAKAGDLEMAFIPLIEEKINAIYRISAFNELFNDANEILNEQSIIIDETSVKRPDRIILKADETIVLDYKTGIPNKKDEKQVREYVKTLQQMNMPSVKGYIFYTSLNELRLI